MKKLLLFGLLITCYSFYSFCLQQELLRLSRSLQTLHGMLEKPITGLLGPQLLQAHPNYIRAHNTTDNWYQINVLKQREWQTCGFHAIKNSLYLLHALDQPVASFPAIYTELQKQAVFDHLFSSWKTFNAEATKLGLFPIEVQELATAISNKKYASNTLENHARNISVLSQLGKNLSSYPADKLKDIKEDVGLLEGITNEKKLNDVALIIEIVRGMTPQEVIPLIIYLRFLQSKPHSPTNHAFIIGNERHWVTVVAHLLKENKEFLIADSLGDSVASSFKQQLNNFFLLQTFEANTLAWYFIDYVYLQEATELFANNEIFPLFLETISELGLQNTSLYLSKYKERIQLLIEITQESLETYNPSKADSIKANIAKTQSALLS